MDPRMEKKYIYLDNAAITRTDPEVVKAMEPYFTEHYGIPGSDLGHSFDMKAIETLENSRRIIAEKINAETDEIIFTSGDVESNNIAIKGMANKHGKGHIITTKIEKSSVLGICGALEKNGFGVTYLNVDREGFVNLKELEDSIVDDTILVTIGHANREVGTIQDLNKIGEICSKKGVPLHTDASSSFTRVPINVKKMNLAMVSITSHMIHGPKGVGALYVRKGTQLNRLFDGGTQEFGIRPGTHNIPGIVGFAKAVQLSNDEDIERITRLRDKLIDGLLKIPNSRLNGPRKNRLCCNVNVSFSYVEGESMLLHMDMRDVAIGTGSACYSKQLKPSHVLSAMGYEAEEAHGSVRLVLSKYTKEEDTGYVVENLSEVVKKLREMSAMG